MRNTLFYALVFVFVGFLSCTSENLDKDPIIDKITILDENGKIRMIELDQETGKLITDSQEGVSMRIDPYPPGHVFKGTVFDIVDHPNGNRRIDCNVSNEECYTVGEGPGPCETCN